MFSQAPAAQEWLSLRSTLTPRCPTASNATTITSTRCACWKRKAVPMRKPYALTEDDLFELERVRDSLALVHALAQLADNPGLHKPQMLAGSSIGSAPI